MKVNNGRRSIFYQNTLWSPGKDGLIELPDSYAATLRSTEEPPFQHPDECKVVKWPDPGSPFFDLRNTTPPARTTGVEKKDEERGLGPSATLDKLNATIAERDALIAELRAEIEKLEKPQEGEKQTQPPAPPPAKK